MKPAQQERIKSARQNSRQLDTVDKAYATYNACNTKEAIAMAQDGINKVNALCPHAATVAPPPAAKTVVFAEAALFDVDKAALKLREKKK